MGAILGRIISKQLTLQRVNCYPVVKQFGFTLVPDVQIVWPSGRSAPSKKLHVHFCFYFYLQLTMEYFDTDS